MNFDPARRVADAVLLEGYVLYPYRASAPKNRYRWQFGVLAPRDWSEGPRGCERWWLEAQCLVHRAGPLEGCLRFLQLSRRTVDRALDPEGRAFAPTESLELDDRVVTAWDEGELREVEIALAGADRAAGAELVAGFEVPGGRDRELVRDRDGAVLGRVTRHRWPLSGQIRVKTEEVGADLLRLAIRVDNTTPVVATDAPRDQALCASLLSTHLVLGVTGGGRFLSLVDAPDFAQPAAAACRSTASYPVLAGPEGQDDLLLCAPIILYDHPRIAPESPGDFFDATEIDELLALRTETLTDEEKRAVRGTDARSAALLDRVAGLPPEMMERLHGAVRSLAPVADQRPDQVGPADMPAPPGLEVGSCVRLRAGRHRTDAQDLLYDGCIARIEKVVEDVEGRTMLGVTIVGDPAAELHRWYGRYHYYGPDEVEPLAEELEAPTERMPRQEESEAPP